MSNVPLNFEDLTPAEVPVSIAGRHYVLREATGDAAVKYQNAVTKCSRFTDGKFSGIQGSLADTQPLLVSLCLFDVEHLQGSTDPKLVAKPVAEHVIRSWPYRIQRSLFDRAKELSGLADEETQETLTKQIADLQEKLAKLQAEEDPSKNGPDTTTDGSN